MQTDHSLLREAIRAILREMDVGDLSGKSLSKVAELVKINRRLRDAGLGWSALAGTWAAAGPALCCVLCAALPLGVVLLGNAWRLLGPRRSRA